MVDKPDQTASCNSAVALPIPELRQEFCQRCVNPECCHSIAHGVFAQRVSTWEDRLFKNPPQMDPNDPRYQLIAAQSFIAIDPSRIPEIGASRGTTTSEWIDPRDLVKKEEPPQAKPAPAPPPPPPKEEKVEEPEKEEPPKVDEAPVETQEKPVVEQPPVPARQGPLQTPYQQGAMLGTPEPKKPEKDPWDNPQATTDGVKIVKPGSKIRFGS